MTDRLFDFGGRKIAFDDTTFKRVRVAQDAEKAGGVTVGQKPKQAAQCGWSDCKKTAKWVPVIHFPIPDTQGMNVSAGDKEWKAREYASRTAPFLCCAKHKKALKRNLVELGNEGYEKQDSDLKVKVTFLRLAELAQVPIMPLELPPGGAEDSN